MKRVKDTDIYVPDYDSHFSAISRKTGLPGAVGYQVDRVAAAIAELRETRVAVDVGAHVGLITRELAKTFRWVHAFEPNPDNFECLRENTKHLPNVIVHRCAVGDRTGMVSVSNAPAGNTGDRTIVPVSGAKGCDPVPIIALDDIAFDEVDLIKVDVQGYECAVINGALKTIRYHRPVMIVENEPEMATNFGFGKTEIDSILKRTGSKVVKTISADKIWVFDESSNVPFEKYEARGDYHWQADNNDGPDPLKDVVDSILAQHAAAGSGELLDVGCGDGAFTQRLGAYGIDNSVEGIALAQKHGVRCEVLDVFEVGKLGRRFAAACLLDTLEHLHNQSGAINALSKVTDRLYILNPEPCGSRHHAREFTRDGLSDWMVIRGWSLVQESRHFRSARNVKTLLTYDFGRKDPDTSGGVLSQGATNIPYVNRDASASLRQFRLDVEAACRK